MEKRGGKSAILWTIIIVIGIIALVHTLFQLYVYGMGTDGLYKKAVSGFAFADSSKIDAMKTAYPNSRMLSLFLVIAEWIALGALVLGTRNHRKKFSMTEIKQSVSESKSKKSVSKTDMDVLYDLLKEKKELSVSEIAKAFDISSETAMEWCEMLEDSNLAEIEYSNMGSATIKAKS